MSAPTVQAAAPAASLERWRIAALLAGVALLAFAWGGPLPGRAEASFAMHMVLHMSVVALAAPLIALGLTPLLSVRLSERLARAALLCAGLEFLMIWAWHAPALHDLARRDTTLLVLEQGSFLVAGLLVWVSALSGHGSARAGGVGSLLLTSMHMTLLGALLMFAGHPLYACADLCSPLATMTPLQDQQTGGVIMLAVGGSVYLVAGLAILGRLLGDRQTVSGEIR